MRHSKSKHSPESSSSNGIDELVLDQESAVRKFNGWVLGAFGALFISYLGFSANMQYITAQRVARIEANYTTGTQTHEKLETVRSSLAARMDNLSNRVTGVEIDVAQLQIICTD